MNPPPYTTTNAFDQYSRCAVPSIVRMRLHEFTHSRRSKLLVMTWLCGAARQYERNASLRRVQLAAMCPGAIASNIARNTPYLASVVTFFMKIFFPSPYKAAAPVVWMALADDISAPSGQPIYYQHLWQAVRHKCCLCDCLFVSHFVTESALGQCHGYSEKRARVCRHECRHRQPVIGGSNGTPKLFSASHSSIHSRTCLHTLGDSTTL